MQADEERQGNLVQEYEQRFEKLSEDQKLSKLWSGAGLRLVESEQLFYALPSPREEGNQSSCREYTMPRDQEGSRIKGWIQSNVRFGPAQGLKSFATTTEETASKFRVPSLFQDQPVSWIRKVNGIDKFVREAMPIQEEERASVKPAAKAKPILKTSSIPALHQRRGTPNVTTLHWVDGSPLQPQAEGNKSLMWPYHNTGTPGCSTPLCSVPQHCTQGR